MLPGDEILYRCNETELLQMARAQGLPPLRRGIPRQQLIDIVAGGEPGPEHVSVSAYTRELLQNHINKHWNIVWSQLPGCTGQCTTFGCTEAKHAACFVPNQALLA